MTYLQFTYHTLNEGEKTHIPLRGQEVPVLDHVANRWQSWNLTLSLSDLKVH